MAYGYRARRRTRRSYTRRRVSTRRVYRRPSRKTALRPRRRMMSRKRILNIASVKKQDNMQPVVANNSGGGAVPGPYGYSAFGSAGTVVPAQFIWCATARDRVSNLSPGDPNASSVRTKDNVYMRGLKERILLQTNSNVPWRWRRICFTVKGLYASADGAVDSLENSNGWTRFISNFYNTNFGNHINTFLFKGSFGIDWNDVLTAKVDTQRVTVKYDVLRNINSGTNYGVLRSYKMWMPMNKSLVYANDELGESESSDTHSTQGKAGMGDYFIVDYFQSHAVATSNDSLSFEPQATLYWHER